MCRIFNELTMLAPLTILVNSNEFICKQMIVPFTFNICSIRDVNLFFLIISSAYMEVLQKALS